MVDIWSPAVLNRVVQDLKVLAPEMFLTTTFFPEVQISNAEEIFFDVMTGKPRLSPFVSPLVEGHIVERAGYNTSSLKPAYVKDKRVFEDGRPIRRLPGEPIYGVLDPMDHRRRLIAQDSLDQIAMLNRRLEWMASEVMRTGKVTISGEKYPTTVVDFGRHSSLTVVHTGTDLWSDAASTPLTDLEDFAGLIRAQSGANAVDVIMAENVWRTMRGKSAILDLLDNPGRDALTALNVGPAMMNNGATFVGRVGVFNLWVHSESYVGDDGTTRRYVPDDYLLMAARGQTEGVRHFGGIKDERAGFQATDFFQKSWTQEDPAVRYLMLQSAPLLVPYRVNATLSAKVL